MFKYLSKGISTLIVINIIVLVVIIAGAGILAYRYLQAPKEESKKQTPSQQISPTLPTSTPSLTNRKDIIDCGIIEVTGYVFPNYKEAFESDSALVCLGNNIINNCKNSKAKEEKSLIYSIKGNGNSGCKIRVELPDAAQILEEDLKKFANKYVECPLSGVISFIGEGELPSDPSSYPGTYAHTLFFQMAVLVTLGFEEAEDKYGCEGELINVWEITP